MLTTEESIRKLEMMSQQFGKATESLSQIFRDLKMVPTHTPSSDSIMTTKFAASAAIISDLAVVMREAANPDKIQVAVQLGKIKDKTRIALPGGAVLSNEELAWIGAPENQGVAAPANLFYKIAQQQLAEKGTLDFSYDLGLAREQFNRSLTSNLTRELTEELGGDAANQVKVQYFLKSQRETILNGLTIPSPESAKEISLSLNERGVTLEGESTLKGIYTKVQEHVAIAVGPVDKIAALATDNEEAKGIRVKSLGELLTISVLTAVSTDTYLNFKRHCSERHGSDGIRNPSTTWGLGLLTDWIKERLIDSLSYREGPRGPRELNP